MVNNLSTSVMDDKTWRGIITHSIPPTVKWLPVIPFLYAMSTSADIISTLFAHGMIIGRDKNTKSSPSNTVLVARTVNPCTNPNCKAKKQSTHMTNYCYWPGGGKEGQSPNFGQRNWANIVVTSIPTPTQPEHFVLSVQVPDVSGQSGVLISTPNDHTTSTLNDCSSTAYQSRVPEVWHHVCLKKFVYWV